MNIFSGNMIERTLYLQEKSTNESKSQWISPVFLKTVFLFLSEHL